MPDEVIQKIDAILLRIQAKQADLAYMRSKQVKQHGLRQVKLSDAERLIQMDMVKKKHDQEISKMIEELNLKG